MWKKPEGPETMTTKAPVPPAPVAPSPIQSSSASNERAIIGPSISVKGEITGAEDLFILGFVDGTVNLKQNVVTVGKSGRVNANVYGRILHVEGEVTGDCYGTEQVIVHKSGQVRGNISAPRVTLEDGARLKGAIDTSVGTAETTATSAQPQKPAQNDTKAPAQTKRDPSTQQTVTAVQ